MKFFTIRCLGLLSKIPKRPQWFLLQGNIQSSGEFYNDDPWGPGGQRWWQNRSSGRAVETQWSPFIWWVQTQWAGTSFPLQPTCGSLKELIQKLQLQGVQVSNHSLCQEVVPHQVNRQRLLNDSCTISQSVGCLNPSFLISSLILSYLKHSPARSTSTSPET